MRIITGILKGRKLSIPESADVRPTSDRAKEGIFSVIESRRLLQGCSILDMFAGSGNLGFEALSRGAGYVRFIDNNRKCLEYIRRAAKTFDMEPQCQTNLADALKFLAGPAIPNDIILADPPYAFRKVGQLAEKVLQGTWLKKGGWFILEHNKYHNFENYDHFLLEKKYGRAHVSFFQQTAPV